MAKQPVNTNRKKGEEETCEVQLAAALKQVETHQTTIKDLTSQVEQSAKELETEKALSATLTADLSDVNQKVNDLDQMVEKANESAKTAQAKLGESQTTITELQSKLAEAEKALQEALNADAPKFEDDAFKAKIRKFFKSDLAKGINKMVATSTKQLFYLDSIADIKEHLRKNRKAKLYIVQRNKIEFTNPVSLVELSKKQAKATSNE